MRFLSTLAILAIAASNALAQVDYHKHFRDSTLRIDYILGGKDSDVSVSLRAKHLSPGWHGRINNLDKLKYTGNDQVTVTSLAGDTLYRNSFSSLFNEWLSLGDSVATAAEACVLVPFPKEPVNVTLDVLDKWHKPIASHTQKIDPNDILIRRNPNEPLPHVYLHKGSYPGHRIKVAILAEGYTPDEMDDFIEHAATATEAILSHEPFTEMADRFDFIAVKSPSKHSGVTVPKHGQWRDTAFGSHFSTFYSDRYLTTPNVFDVYDALNGVPFEHIIILANTDEYGGGGIFNDYTLTTARHANFRPVVVHEFGHSFGGLADEYFYDGDVMDDTYPLDAEPWEPNITTLVDFTNKWGGLIPEGTPIPTPTSVADKYPIGIYEGAGYSFKGLYRPADYCRMRINDIDAFCKACQKSMRDLIIFYTE